MSTRTPHRELFDPATGRRSGIAWIEHPGVVKRRVRAHGYNLDTGEACNALGLPQRTYAAQCEEIGI